MKEQTKKRIPTTAILKMMDDGYTVSEIAKVLRLRTEDVRNVAVRKWMPLFVG